jgi:hypothetical protein
MDTEQNPTEGSPPAPKKRGRPPGSKNKPKVVTPSPDLNKTDGAAGEVSTENNPKFRAAARNSEVNKGITELENFVVERKVIAQLQPLVDQINHGFDAADEQGRALLHTVRATGVMLLEWKAKAGHGHWMEVYETSGFHKSIDTAENWMKLSVMTDAQISEVTSVREALALLKDKKKAKKRDGKSLPNPKPEITTDDIATPAKPEPESLESALGDIMKKAMTPHPDEEKDVDKYKQPGDEPEDELTLLDELEMVMKRVCAEYPKQETAKILASMLNDFYQPKEEATV